MTSGIDDCRDTKARLDTDATTEVHRYKWLQRFERSDLHRVLDAALVAHVGFVRDGMPVVIPMGFARDGHSLIVHGSTGAGLNQAAARGVPMSATITLLDGLVYEESLFDSTLNYRSAMIFGEAVPVPREDTERCVKAISDRLMPGRWDEVRRPTRKELAATHILRLSLDRASVKIREGGPSGEPRNDLWTGHLPLSTTVGLPMTQPGCTAPVAASVAAAVATLADGS